MQDDEALIAARALLKQAPVFDGHNDLPWVIRQDKAARGASGYWFCGASPARAS